ncbi:MAG: histidine kinase dimerization/phosphoacceptor domain -containing protein [Terracidiphilus sp.]
MPATPSSRQVLLVEDDPATAELVRRTLGRSGYTVEIAPGVEAGLHSLSHNGSVEYVALLLDYKLPDGEPWALADAAKARIPEVPVIFVTAATGEAVAIEAVRRGFADYVRKSDGFWDELPAVLERVTRLSQMKSRLDETGALTRAIVDQSSDLIAVSDGDGKMMYVSPACFALLGRNSGEMVGRSWTEIVAAEDREALIAMLARTNQTPAQPATLRSIRKDGSLAWMETRVALLTATFSAQPLIVLTMHEVTAQRENEQQIHSSLREKEVLLREIHHRVKNNLQVVQSLLKMQSRLLPEGEIRAALAATIQRVRAMALLHEGLYQRTDLARISLTDYLRDLFSGVEASSIAEPGQVLFMLDVEDIQLSLDTAAPFGLLANELMTNCFKHGFPDGRRGVIEISIHRVDGVAHMVVKDDGIGLPQHFDASASPSMGLKLAASLAHQLGGRLEFTSDHGCRIESMLTRL